jgi:glutamine synthetase
MTAADALSLIKEKEAKFVDLRFTDTKGKEQHVTVPASVVDDGFFEDGKMFDGSSIAGWKGINESDMILMPDPDTAVVDVFTDDATINIRCDVYEPATMQAYERCPRMAARRAEEYLKSTGIADEAFFGPENEFFIFDDVRYGTDMHQTSYRVDSAEASWNSLAESDDGNIGHRPGVKGGYFPVPPVDSGHDIRSSMCLALWPTLMARPRRSCQSHWSGTTVMVRMCISHWRTAVKISSRVTDTVVCRRAHFII